MKGKLLYVLAFIAGGAIGAVVTRQLIKDKYSKMAQEEIDSVKAVFSNRNSGINGVSVGQDKTKSNKISAGNMPDLSDLVSRLKNEHYISENVKEEAEAWTKTNKIIQHSAPYVIAPEEFGEFDNYEQISLMYYADGVLADDQDELVENVEEIVGFDSLTHFGEYEDDPDSVFVRNDERRCDYEILKSYNKYSEVVQGKPHLRMEK